MPGSAFPRDQLALDGQGEAFERTVLVAALGEEADVMTLGSDDTDPFDAGCLRRVHAREASLHVSKLLIEHLIVLALRDTV